MKRRQFTSAIAGLAAGPFIRTARAQPGRSIVLGQSAALTGPASELGQQFRVGAMLVFDQFNAHGGLNGLPIELRSLDDGYEPERCVANTRELINSGAFALFGYIGTPTSLAALPGVTAAKIPFAAPFTGAEALRAPFNRHVFHVRASYFDETGEIVKQLATVGIKRIGVFYQNDSYGKAGLAGVLQAMKPLGIEPTGLGTVERNTVDVSAAVKDILLQKPDAIVQISAYKSCAAFIRAARRAGFGGSFYNVSFVGTQALALELQSDARGVVVSQVMPFPFTPAVPVAAEYLAAGKAAHGEKFIPNYSSMEGFVAARTMVEALRRMGPAITQEALMNAFESLRQFNLGGFFIDFGPQRHAGSHFVDLTILSGDGRVRR